MRARVAWPRQKEAFDLSQSGALDKQWSSDFSEATILLRGTRMVASVHFYCIPVGDALEGCSVEKNDGYKRECGKTGVKILLQLG